MEYKLVKLGSELILIEAEKTQVVTGKLYYEPDNCVPVYEFSQKFLPKSYYLNLVVAKGSNIDLTNLTNLTNLIEHDSVQVEIETVLQMRHGVEWYDLPNQSFGNDPEGIYRRVPKITKGKIKIIGLS
jgi:hypothetical protein